MSMILELLEEYKDTDTTPPARRLIGWKPVPVSGIPEDKIKKLDAQKKGVWLPPLLRPALEVLKQQYVFEFAQSGHMVRYFIFCEGETTR